MNSHDFIPSQKNHFRQLTDALLADLKAGEEAVFSLNAENSLYLRLNGNRVRQNTSLEQMVLQVQLQSQRRTTQRSWVLTGDRERDLAESRRQMNLVREELRHLPEDPFQIPLTHHGTSDDSFRSSLLKESEVVDALTSAAEGVDLAGIYCGGAIISANRNSRGQDHWFATESFFMDYSVYQGPKAAKSSYAGSAWNPQEWTKNLSQARRQLELLQRPTVDIKPGKFRVFLAPGAVHEILGTLHWGALGYGTWKKGQNALAQLANGERQLSPLFSLRENFTLGLSPRFNSLGEVSAESVPLIERGILKSWLTSSRSAKEFGVTANGANENEAPRSPEIATGSLKDTDVLKELGTGLWLGHLHYLNWSDRTSARITGMTRYACFWVEKGEIVGPIKDMRFDESLYDAFGPALRAVTSESQIEPATGTYFARSLGGAKIPGMLIDDFTFTL